VIDLITANPKTSLIIISTLITLVMTIVTKYVTNQTRMKELKDIQKACNIRLKENRNDPKVISEVNKQLMECSLELMKHSFKPMFYTFIPIIVIFWWIKNIFTPILEHWIWWYLGSAIIASIIFRKVFKVV